MEKEKSYISFDLEKIGEFGEHLKNWVGKIEHIHVAVDLGASSGRICFQPVDKKTFRRVRSVKTLKIKFGETNCNKKFYENMNSISEIYSKYFPSKPVCFSCLGVAGPVKGKNHKIDKVEITNYEDGQKTIELEKLPRELFPVERTYFLNDMEANNYGLISLGIQGKLEDFFDPNFFHNNYPSKELNPTNMKPFSYYMINMGTGLGNGLLYYFEEEEVHKVIPMEIGHLNMLPEYSDLEAEEKDFDGNMRDEVKKLRDFEESFYRFLKHDFLKKTPEVEDYCSGKRGVINLYEGFKRYGHIMGKEYEVDTKKYPDSKKFRDEDIPCFLKDHPMINLFQWRKLFYVIQQVCLTFPTIKGIFLCGNNISRKHNRDCVVNNKKMIMFDFFVRKRKCVHWLNDMECYIQKNYVNTNLIGSFFVLKKIMEKVGLND